MVKKEEEEEKAGAGTRTDIAPFCKLSLQPYSFATRKLLLFVDLNNKLNDPIVGSVFNNIHSRGQILLWKFLANINSR